MRTAIMTIALAVFCEVGGCSKPQTSTAPPVLEATTSPVQPRPNRSDDSAEHTARSKENTLRLPWQSPSQELRQEKSVPTKVIEVKCVIRRVILPKPFWNSPSITQKGDLELDVEKPGVPGRQNIKHIDLPYAVFTYGDGKPVPDHKVGGQIVLLFTPSGDFIAEEAEERAADMEAGEDSEESMPGALGPSDAVMPGPLRSPP